MEPQNTAESIEKASAIEKLPKSSSNAERSPTLDPIWILERAFRGRRIFAALLIAICASFGAVVGFFATQPVYLSSGMLLISVRPQKTLYSQGSNSWLRMFDSFVAEQVAQLNSRPLLEQARDRMLDDPMVAAPSLHDVRRMLEVSSEEGIITVTARHADPIIAASAVNTLLDGYWDFIQTESDNRFNALEQELGHRVDSLLEEIRLLRDERLMVGEEYGEKAVSKAHLHKVTQIEDLDQRIVDLTATIAEREAVGESTLLDAGNREILRLMVLDNALANLLIKRVDSLKNFEDVKRNYRPEHPAIVESTVDLLRIDEAIEARRQQLTGLDQASTLRYGNSDKEDPLDSLRGLKEKLDGRLFTLRGEARALNEKRVLLEHLAMRESGLYRYLDDARDALEVIRVESRSAVPGIVEVQSRGRVSDTPVADKRKKFAAAGMFGGVLTALVGLVLTSMFGIRIRYSDDLRREQQCGLGLEVIPEGRPQSQGTDLASRSLEALWSRLCFTYQRNRQDLRTVCVFGAEPSAGASTIAISLARSFAQTSKKVVLVDMNPFTGSASERLGANVRVGFIESMTTRDPIPYIVDTEVPGLDLLPAENSGSGSPAISGPAWVKVSHSLLEHYDVVVVDGRIQSPLFAPRIITEMADASLLVTRAGTERVTARSAAMELGTSAGQPLMHVFNRARPDDPGVSRW